jgi:hypothetical protein
MLNYVLSVLIVLAYWLPCDAAVPEEGWRIHEERGYVFWQPKEWDNADWKYTSTENDDDDKTIITKDGVFLEFIEIRNRDFDGDDQFTKKKLSAEMAPRELAEIILNELATDKDNASVILHENKPITISGVPAFKAVFSYRESCGLLHKVVYCGFIKDDKFFSIQYVAPARHYFDKYLPVFEKVMQSFKLEE